MKHNNQEENVYFKNYHPLIVLNLIQHGKYKKEVLKDVLLIQKDYLQHKNH